MQTLNHNSDRTRQENNSVGFVGSYESQKLREEGMIALAFAICISCKATMIIEKWTFSNNEYIYRQLARKIEYAIFNKKFSAGEIIPSIRETAQILHINPNTASRAYKIVKNKGLIFVSRSGSYSVISDERYIVQKRDEAVTELCSLYLQNMLKLGINKKEAVECLQVFCDELKC